MKAHEGRCRCGFFWHLDRRKTYMRIDFPHCFPHVNNDASNRFCFSFHTYKRCTVSQRRGKWEKQTNRTSTHTAVIVPSVRESVLTRRRANAGGRRVRLTCFRDCNYSPTLYFSLCGHSSACSRSVSQTSIVLLWVRQNTYTQAWEGLGSCHTAAEEAEWNNINSVSEVHPVKGAVCRKMNVQSSFIRFKAEFLSFV